MGFSIVDDLVLEEMERIVADAQVDGGLVSATAVADRIKRAYPGRFSERHITDKLIVVASQAGVAVAIGR